MGAEAAKGHQPAGGRAGTGRQAQELQGMAKRHAKGEQAMLALAAAQVQAPPGQQNKTKRL